MHDFVIGIDASRANEDKKTGVGWYAFHLIQEMKQCPVSNFPCFAKTLQNEQCSNPAKIRFILYSKEPLKGALADLPANWESRVLCWPPKRFWTQIRLSWEMLVRPPDVLFIPAHVPPLIHPKKTVMTVHDIAAVRYPESYAWFERWYTQWSAKFALKSMWKVIVPSQFVREELNTEYRIQNAGLKKVCVVHHGYDVRYRKIKDQIGIQKLLNKYQIHNPFLLTIGRLEEKKNTRRIVQAFDRLSHHLSPVTYHLVVVGSPGHGYESVVTAIRQSPYRDRIHELGYVTQEDLPYLMNAAEALVFPSLYEGFGIPVLEAMACGTPVLASKGNSIEEIAGDAAIYVDPLNVEDIAQGIKEVIQSPQLKLQKIQKGFERVKLFSWKRSAKETLDLLLEEVN